MDSDPNQVFADKQTGTSLNAAADGDFTQRLPVEILDAIADDAIGAQSDDWHRVIFTRGAIARLSRRWNGVVYGNRLFWNTLVVHRCTPPAFLENCLKHSGGAALALTIDGREHKELPVGDLESTARAVKNKFMGSFLVDVLDLLREHFHLVATLDLHFEDHSDLMTAMRALVMYSADMLRTLRWIVWDWGRSTEDETDEERLELPSWRGSPPISTMHAMTSIPVWRNGDAYKELTVLKLHIIRDHVPWAALRSILVAAVHLRVLIMRDVFVEDATPAASVATLSSVEDFCLCIRTNEAAAIASKLHLPGLRLLRVDAQESASLTAIYDANPEIFQQAGRIDISADHRAIHELEDVLSNLQATTELDLERSSLETVPTLLDIIEGPGISLPCVLTVKLPGGITRADAAALLPSFGVGCSLFSHQWPAYGWRRWWLDGGEVMDELMPVAEEADPWY